MFTFTTCFLLCFNRTISFDPLESMFASLKSPKMNEPEKRNKKEESGIEISLEDIKRIWKQAYTNPNEVTFNANHIRALITRRIGEMDKSGDSETPTVELQDIFLYAVSLW